MMSLLNSCLLLLVFTTYTCLGNGVTFPRTSTSDSKLMTSREVPTNIRSSTSRTTRATTIMPLRRTSLTTTTITRTTNTINNKFPFLLTNTTTSVNVVTTNNSVSTAIPTVTTDNQSSSTGIPTSVDMTVYHSVTANITTEDAFSISTTSTTTKENDSEKSVLIVTLSAIIGVLVIVVTTTIICVCIIRNFKVKSQHHNKIRQDISGIRLSGTNNTYGSVPLDVVNPAAGLKSSESVSWNVPSPDEKQNRSLQNSEHDVDNLEEPEKLRTDKDGDSGYTEVDVEGGLPVAGTSADSEGKESRKLKPFNSKEKTNGYSEVIVDVRTPVTIIHINSNEESAYTDKDVETCQKVPRSAVIKGKDNYDHIVLHQSKVVTTELADSPEEDSKTNNDDSVDPAMF